jgi:hypothetical protein
MMTLKRWMNAVGVYGWVKPMIYLNVAIVVCSDGIEKK